MFRSTVYSCRDRATLTLYFVVAIAPATAAPPTYRIQTLPPLATGNSYAIGLNDAGVVVGTGWTISGFRAVRWTNGVPTVLGALPADSRSTAYSIANDQRIIGKSGPECGGSDPMVFEAGQLNPLPDVPRIDVWVYALNDAGVAVGEGVDSCARPWNDAAYRWEYVAQDGNWIVSTLPPLPGEPEAGAYALNASGVAVGFSGDTSGAAQLRAVRWDESQPSLLPDLGGGHSIAAGIDDAGRVVGYSRTPGGLYRAYFFDGAAATDLGVLGGYPNSASVGLNNAGTVIGYGFSGTLEDVIFPYLPPTSMRGFIWRNGQLHDAIGLIPADSGWTSLDRPRDINERGQIAGEGRRGGLWRGFLLTPECLFQGDLNDDRTINQDDLDLLLFEFGCTGFVCRGDVDGDGDVDQDDLDVLLFNFGTTCP